MFTADELDAVIRNAVERIAAERRSQTRAKLEAWRARGANNVYPPEKKGPLVL